MLLQSRINQVRQKKIHDYFQKIPDGERSRELRRLLNIAIDIENKRKKSKKIDTNDDDLIEQHS